VTVRSHTRAALKAALAPVPGAAWLGRQLSPGPTILMYHRFSAQPAGDGHTVDAALCDWQFRVLQREAAVWPLGDYFEAVAADAAVPKNLVVITVDDGYRDFFEIAFPLLRRLELPATLFPVVQFIERKIWLWHDRLAWLLAQAEPTQHELRCADGTVRFDLSSEDGRRRAWNDLCRYCIRQRDDDKHAFLRALEQRSPSRVPDTLPAAFAPCTWDELEEMSAASIEIGAHSMTHPILSKVDPETLWWEVSEPRRALKERLGREVRSFCYPNGQPDDVNAEVLSAVERAGYLGAVVTQRAPPDYGRYSTSRIGTSTQKNDFLWKVRGWEQGIARLRGRNGSRPD
jgi:peptidoglycan/xylan/chitin deacetylase (PgdA/CDA1 family)